MSKIKITSKELKSRYPKILTVAYCTMQNLLRYQQELYYNSGAYGWNYDGYNINGVLIVTGYRTFKGTLKTNYDLINEYEEKARILNNDYNLDYDIKVEKVNNLLNEFISKL